MTPDAPLNRLLDRRTRALVRHLPAALDGDPRAVHQARVASRRLREAVPVVAAGLRGARRRKLCRALRGITRALGRVRELDVSLAALDGRRAAPVDRAAIELVRAGLQRARGERREEMLGHLSAIDRDKLVARLRRMRALVSDPGRGAAWRAELARRLARRAHALREAVDEAGALYVPARLHAARIASKKLRYALELAGETRTAGTAPLVRTLKRTQDTLGRLHDLQVLIEHVKAVEAEPAAHRAVSPEALQGLARALETECRALHARYVAAGSDLAALSAKVVAGIVPRVGPVPAAGGRPAPLKMTLDAASGGAARRPAGRGR